MRWSTVVGALAVLAVGVWSVGAIVSLVITALSGEYQLPSAVVLAIVGVSVLAVAVIGAKGPRWVYNSEGFYW